MPWIAQYRSGGARQIVVAMLIVGGLMASVIYNVWTGTPGARVPGVALASESLLVAERSVAFFVIWLLAVLVVVNALGGRLPIELSGRGIRYADAPATQAIAEGADRGLEEVWAEVARQRKELGALQKAMLSGRE